MLEPQQQLRKLSFDSDLELVLRTPNRIKYRQNQFEGWEDRQEHPIDSPQRKISYNTERAKFKIKQSKIKINPDPMIKSVNQMIQDKENTSNDKFFNLKMVQIIDNQTLSPNSRKLLTPNKPKHTDEPLSGLYTRNRFYQTPKTTNRTKQSSLHKLSMTEGVNKISYSEKREKHFNDETEDSDQNGYKIPLSAIVYPVLRANNKKNPRRIERFHSFVARTVRK